MMNYTNCTKKNFRWDILSAGKRKIHNKFLIMEGNGKYWIDISESGPLLYMINISPEKKKAVPLV
jgi:hypothetical protein